MKIVILGGAGLIGSKVVNLLRARGHELVAASPSQGNQFDYRTRLD